MKATSTAIRAKLAPLQQLTMTASATTQDAINWSRVGNLGPVNLALNDVLAIFDGEHA